MKFLAGFVALASMAAAAPNPRGGPTPLDVQLEMAGNSAVKATITNNGKNNLKVLKTGTIFDSSAVEKATVSANGMSHLHTPIPPTRQHHLHETNKQAKTSNSTVSASTSPPTTSKMTHSSTSPRALPSK